MNAKTMTESLKDLLIDDAYYSFLRDVVVSIVVANWKCVG